MSGGPSILVRGALLIIDHECPVSITAVDDGECTPDVTTESPNFARPAIIGGTVVYSCCIDHFHLFGNSGGFSAEESTWKETGC